MLPLPSRSSRCSPRCPRCPRLSPPITATPSPPRPTLRLPITRRPHLHAPLLPRGGDRDRSRDRSRRCHRRPPPPAADSFIICFIRIEHPFPLEDPGRADEGES